jgi:drug/metabolite transporter (DMT)-like permease
LKARTTEAVPRSGIALLGLVAVLWGSNWPVMKRVLAEIPPWTYPAAGLMIAAIVLMIAAKLARQSLRVPAGEWPRLTAIALTNFTLWQVLAAHGVSLLPAGRAAILNFTMPVWSILLGRLVLSERLTLKRTIALVLGICGVFMLLAGDAAAILAAPLGVAFMLSASISWAVSVVLMKRIPVSLPPMAFTAWQVLIGGLPIVAGAIAFESHLWAPPSATATWGFLYSVVMVWTLGYWAWTRAAVTLPLAVSSLGTLAIPVVGVLGGMLFLGENLPPSDFLALAFLLAALAVLAFSKRAVLLA